MSQTLEEKYEFTREWKKRNREYLREYEKEYYKKPQSPVIRRRYSLKKKYGLTIEQYDEMLQKQNNVCAICQEPSLSLDPRTNKVRRLAVDHCHKTGKIRGLLCSKCNKGIGLFRDNPVLFANVIKYLQEN